VEEKGENRFFSGFNSIPSSPRRKEVLYREEEKKKKVVRLIRFVNLWLTKKVYPCEKSLSFKRVKEKKGK